MNKVYCYILLLLAVTFNAMGQPGVVVSLDKKSPISFLEGERIFLGIIIRNNSKDSIRYSAKIAQVTDQNGSEILNGLGQAIHLTMSHKRKDVEPVKNLSILPTVGPRKEVRFILGDAGPIYTNSSAEDVIPATRAKLSFLAKGVYDVSYLIEINGLPIRNTQRIEIRPSLGEDRNKLVNFINALNNIAKNDYVPSSSNVVGSSTENTLLSLLSDLKNSAYSETIYHYINVQGNATPIDDFRDNSHCIEGLLSLLPEVFKGREWMFACGNYTAALFLDEYFCKVKDRREPERSEFINSFLEKIKTFPVEFSDEIIEKFKRCGDSSKLVNYARIGQTKAKKSDRE
ncbi:MAG TPA: hypothetical protein VF691_19350 [Cytophagaceae bacterium]|jgi:hypothetical protein